MSQEQQQPQQINYRLIKINTEEFTPVEVLQENGNLDLNFDFQFGVNNNQRLVKIISSFIFKLDTAEILKLAVSCEFEFEDAGWNLLQQEENVVLPSGLLSELAVFTINTSRGILHAKTEGHKYNNLILPIIDGQLITEDLKIPINQENA